MNGIALPRRHWPRWDIGRDGLAGLAAYTGIDAVRRLGFEEGSAQSLHDAASQSSKREPGRIGAARAVLEKAYDNLLAREYRYSIEDKPWGTGQVVRDPHAITDGYATCNDLAVMFAAVCKLNGLRPILATLEGVTRGNPEKNREPVPWGHAMIVVDLLKATDEELPGERPWFDELNPLLARGRPAGEGTAYPAADPALAWAQTPVADGWRWGGRYVALDVVAATVDRGDSFAAARASAQTWFTRRDLQTVGLVEVIGAHEYGVPEFDPPREDERLALHNDGDFGGIVGFRHFPSRAEKAGELAGSGLIVLCGESGTGKSLLARHTAGLANDGFGWWLDASSRAALTADLARHEALETGRDPRQVLEPGDVAATAERARRRLADSAGSWVVVLDNADADPGDLRGLVPMEPADNQVLMVTTTDERWCAETGARTVRLSRLPDEDVLAELGDVPPPVRPLLGGLPLLASASDRFRRAAGRAWWEVESAWSAQGPDDAPSRIWRAALALLGPRSEAAEAARAVGWLPPTAVEAAALTGVLEDPDRALREVVAYGLAEQEAGTEGRRVRMHRLFREAVRHGAATPADGEGAAVLVSRLLHTRAPWDVFAEVFDADTTGDIYRIVTDPSRPPASRAADLHRLGTAIERHEPKIAADCLEQALRCLNWAVGDPVELIAESHRLVVADALRTLARPSTRRQRQVGGRAEQEALLDEAIAECEVAERLCAGRTGDEWRLTRSRTEAVHGIALRGKAGLYKASDRRRARELLEQSRGLLESSHAERQELARGSERPDVDRSQYNLAGLEIEFAQVDRRDRAAGHLAAAERHYSEVLRARRIRFRSDEYEDVACCINGLGLVAYYRAAFLPVDHADRAGLLRTAADFAAEAAAIRVKLRGQDPYDGPDASKSVSLGALVALARLRNNREAGAAGPRDVDALVQYGFEWAGLGTSSVWMLGSDASAEVVAAPSGPPSRFEPVAQVGDGADWRADVVGWAASEPVRGLVYAFGAEDENLTELLDGHAGDPAGLLAALDAFTDRWDTRGGRERNLVGELPMTQSQSALVLRAADALGLRSPGRPRHREYDHVLLLGGMVRACFLRPAYAARLLREDGVATRSVVALGARRPLAGDEVDLALEIGVRDPVKADEFAMLDAGTRQAFGLGRPTSARAEPGAPGDEFGGWEALTYTTGAGVPVTVAAAPSSAPRERRADTADAYAWFATTLAELEPGQRILAVTTDIYRPYQHVAALRMLALPYGVEVETVGHVPAGVEPVLRQPFSPTKYLLEIRSAVKGCRALLEQLDRQTAAT